MRAEFCHVNFNVLDLERSLAFYEEALGLHEVRRREGRDFILVYMGDGTTDFTLELTWMKERKEPSSLGFIVSLFTIGRRRGHEKEISACGYFRCKRYACMPVAKASLR